MKAGISLPWLVARTNPKNPTSPPVPGAIVATGPYTLVVHQAVPNGAFINQLFDSIATWIASPTAIAKEGESQFAKYPVGAGPFTVVSDDYSNELVVKKNPTYWEAGRPYLDQITFKVVGSDEAAIEAMLSGEGQVYEGLGTYQLIGQDEQHFRVLDMEGTSPYDLQLNTAIPPFKTRRRGRRSTRRPTSPPSSRRSSATGIPSCRASPDPAASATSSTPPGVPGI